MHEKNIVLGNEWVQTSSQKPADQCGKRQAARYEAHSRTQRRICRVQKPEVDFAFVPAARALQHVRSAFDERHTPAMTRKLKSSADTQHSAAEDRDAIACH